MKRKALLCLCVLAFSFSAQGRPGRTAAIDDFCVAIRNEFVEAAPRYFSGPDPWVQLDRLPDAFADAALAIVYSEGPRVRRVVIEMAGPSNGWFETTQYFFDETGNIKKRERHLDQNSANVRIEESTYFHKGRMIKTSYHHSPLNRTGKDSENWDAFYDPNAPEYTSTADLPVPFSAIEFKHLAQLENILVCVPAVLKPLQNSHNPC